MSAAPRLTGIKCGEGARPKDSSNRVSAFQDYISAMMSALNNPWKPQSKRTATPTWTAVPPLVFLSTSGTPVSDSQTKKELDARYVPMNFSAIDKTVLTPQGRQEMKGIASPIKFTETLQWGCSKSKHTRWLLDGSIGVWSRKSGGKRSRFLYA